MPDSSQMHTKPVKSQYLSNVIWKAKQKKKIKLNVQSGPGSPNYYGGRSKSTIEKVNVPISRN